MKKMKVMLAALAAMSTTAFAGERTTERLFTFSNNNDGAVKEVNYYLSQGSEVKYLHTAAKTTDSTVIITVVLEIPNGVMDYRDYKRSN
mgnify:FL=1